MIIRRVFPPAVLCVCLGAAIAGAAEPPTEAVSALVEQLRELERTYLQGKKGREFFHAEGGIRIEPDGGTVRVVASRPSIGPVTEELTLLGDVVATVTPLATAGAYRVTVSLPERAEFAVPLDDGSRVSVTLGANRLQGVWRADQLFVTDLDIALDELEVTRSDGQKSRPLFRLERGTIRFAAADDDAGVWRGSGALELTGIKGEVDMPKGEFRLGIRRIAIEGEARDIRPQDWKTLARPRGDRPGPGPAAGKSSGLADGRLVLDVEGVRVRTPTGERVVADRMRFDFDGGGIDPLIWAALRGQTGVPHRITSRAAATGIGAGNFGLEFKNLHIRTRGKDRVVADRMAYGLSFDASREVGDARVEFDISGFSTEDAPTPPSLLPTRVHIVGAASPLPVHELVAAIARAKKLDRGPDDGGHKPGTGSRHRSSAKSRALDARQVALVDALRRHGTSLRLDRFHVAREDAAMSGSGHIRPAAADARFPIEAMLDLGSYGLETLVRRASTLIERGEGVKRPLDQSLAFYLMLLGLGQSAPSDGAPRQRHKMEVDGTGEIRFNGRPIDPKEFAKRLRTLKIRAGRTSRP